MAALFMSAAASRSRRMAAAKVATSANISRLFSNEFSSLVGCGRESLAGHDSSRPITFWVAHTRKARPCSRRYARRPVNSHGTCVERLALGVKRSDVPDLLPIPRSAHAIASKVARDRIAYTRSDAGALGFRPAPRQPAQSSSDRRNHETLAPRRSTSDRPFGGFSHRFAPVVAGLDEGSRRRVVR